MKLTNLACLRGSELEIRTNMRSVDVQQQITNRSQSLAAGSRAAASEVFRPTPVGAVPESLASAAASLYIGVVDGNRPRGRAR